MRSPVSLARLASVCAALSLALPACGSPQGGPVPGPTVTVGPVPVVRSSDLAVGKNRFVFSLLDGRSGRSLAKPGESVRVAFYDLARSRTTAAAAGAGIFEWVEPGVEGAYVVPVDLGSAGSWEAEVHPKGHASARVGFDVRAVPLTPAVGKKAPASATRILSEVGGHAEDLTSDPKPMRRFYRTSIAQAIGMGIPFVVVFASPGHCTSSGCANMLDVAKQVARTTTDLTFIHVELFRDPRSANPQRLDPAVGEWGLPSEPWTFVVSAHGRVTAKFERVVSVEELQAAVHALYA